jgi:hypothetical protein
MPLSMPHLVYPNSYRFCLDKAIDTGKEMAIITLCTREGIPLPSGLTPQ